MFYRIRRQKNDLLIALGIITLLVSIYGYTLFEQGSRIRENALMYELLTLRYSVTLFNLMNGRNPEDLEELISKGFVDFQGNAKKYVPVGFYENKGLVDPFGNPYNYDRESGWINSSTEKYKEW